MSRIYISYRRDDASEAASEIYDYLRNLGFDVALETDSIPAGVEFRAHIDDMVGSAGAVVAVMGQKWLENIHADRDVVRTQLESALERDIPVVPALVDGAKMPRTSELPRTLRELPYLNTAIVRGPPLVRDMAPLREAVTPLASRPSAQPPRKPPERRPVRGAGGNVAQAPPSSPPRPRSPSPAPDTIEFSVRVPSVVKPAIAFVRGAWGRFRAWIGRNLPIG